MVEEENEEIQEAEMSTKATTMTNDNNHQNDNDSGCSTSGGGSSRNGNTFLAVWSCVLGYMEALATHKTERYQIFPIPFQALQRLIHDEFVPKIQKAVNDQTPTTTITIPLTTMNNKGSKTKTKTTKTATVADAEGSLVPPDLSSSSSSHRIIIQSISNMIWSETLNKPNTRDEWHANSVYAWLRCKIDSKSLDCFGSAITTLAGYHVLYRYGMNRMTSTSTTTTTTKSHLALSEDHAYETHTISFKERNDNRHSQPEEDGGKGILPEKGPDESGMMTMMIRGTCEIAIPGKTKADRAKRGREIGETFAKGSILTPQTSWVYMASNPIICASFGMTLAAVIGNINCTIDKKKRKKSTHTKKKTTTGGIVVRQEDTILASGQLFDVKRELLWILYDRGYMSKFPFALMELGDCEQNRESVRGMEECWDGRSNKSNAVVLNRPPILMNEKLYLDAIQINKVMYNDAQVYPYFLLGHYHKDAWEEDHEDDDDVDTNDVDPNVDNVPVLGPETNEIHLVYAMKYYAEAARVASTYFYEGIDTLQLNKSFTSIAMLIAEDMLQSYKDEAPPPPITGDDDNDDDDDEQRHTKKQKKDTTTTTTTIFPRIWYRRQNAIEFCTWLIGFFDHLLYWEEQSNHKQFVQILVPGHPHGMTKLFQMLNEDTRKEAISLVVSLHHDHPTTVDDGKTQEEHKNQKDDKKVANAAHDHDDDDKDDLPGHYLGIRSKRLSSSGSLLLAALQKTKVSIGEMELAFSSLSNDDNDHTDSNSNGNSNNDVDRSRRSKRIRGK